VDLDWEQVEVNLRLIKPKDIPTCDEDQLFLTIEKGSPANLVQKRSRRVQNTKFQEFEVRPVLAEKYIRSKKQTRSTTVEA